MMSHYIHVHFFVTYIKVLYFTESKPEMGTFLNSLLLFED